MRIVRLAEVATIDRHTVEPADIPKGTLYIGLENIQRGGGIVGVLPTEADQLASTKFRFDRSHVLFGKLRPNLAKVARPNFDGVCSTDILPLRPGSELDRGYLAHFLAQPRMVELAASRATGINLPRLSPAELARFELPLPPIEEQRRLTAVLDNTDALRSKWRDSCTLLDELTWSIFYDMFGDAALNPFGWSRATLGELIIDGPQNGLYKPSTDYGMGTRILRIDGFYDGSMSDQSSLKRVRISEDDRRVFALHMDDIVINRVNSLEYLGKCALVPDLAESTVFESNMMRLRVDGRRLEPQYLTDFLRTPYVKSQIAVAAKQAVNQASINQQDVRALHVSLPPISLQTSYVHRRTAISAEVRLRRRAISRLDSLFASLQQRAFSGRL